MFSLNSLPAIYLVIAKWILVSSISLGSLWYIHDLKDTMNDQKQEIEVLNAKILIQNTMIDSAKHDRENLEIQLSGVSKLNFVLKADLEKAKVFIIDRPDAKTCEEAVSYLSATAKKIADDWNNTKWKKFWFYY